MQLIKHGPLPLGSDRELIAQYLPLQDTTLLELGCGTAFATRKISEAYPTVKIIATEVDRIQHEKNLQISDLPNVSFRYGGAEAIDAEDASIDAVIMLKSLHHVPVELMDKGFEEMARVLKPGGLAYISEPVYAGEFNEILRLFNDEKSVREAAFAAVERAVASDKFELAEEVHCKSVSRFEGFEDFEQRILGATHSNFDVDEALFAQIKAAFSPHIGSDGIAEFHNPLRVDILRRI
jgi:ubiquinone/menaquinone biosynthesis C-methylase UbiE